MELYHYGVKGMRWGVRRYQNKNGSLTNAGKKRYKALNGDFVKQFLGDDNDKAEKMYYNVTDADRRLSESSKRFGELDRKITDTLNKVYNNPFLYTKKGWRAKKANDKRLEAACK